jgi:glycosyltransferase involved in cell wall biosynthesis
LRDEEFVPVTPKNDARDLLFLGMLRDLKGVDVFLEAIARLETAYGRNLTAHVIGQTEEPGRYEALSRRLGVADRVAFGEPMPAREAFASARMIVVPSRAESMPYVVLEAIAAGMPVVATDVGGIPEIFGPDAGALVPRVTRRLSPARSMPPSPTPGVPTPRPPPAGTGCARSSTFPPCRTRSRRCTG